MTSKPRVRARRGQATDPHSIAERVSLKKVIRCSILIKHILVVLSNCSFEIQLRREKIAGRLKNLQELVPNSNKVFPVSMLCSPLSLIRSTLF